MKLLFTPYFILCLTLFTLRAQAQLNGAAVADSLLQVMRVSKPDTNRVLYLELGAYYPNKKGTFQADMDSAYTYAGQARALSHKLGDYRMGAKSLNLPGFIDLELKNFHLAIAFQQAATNLFSSPQ